MSKHFSLHCMFDVTTNIYFYFYFNIARDVVTVLLIFVDVYCFNHTFSDAHIYYIGTHFQAHMYDLRTGGMARARHKSLVGRGGRDFFVRDKTPSTHTHTQNEL